MLASPSGLDVPRRAATGARPRQRSPLPAHTGRRVITAPRASFISCRPCPSGPQATCCALSTAESSLPLSLPLSSWRSPSRLVSSSPLTAPTPASRGRRSCQSSRPSRASWVYVVVAETRRLATTNQAKDVDGQSQCGRRRGEHRCDPQTALDEPSPSPCVVAASTPQREQHEDYTSTHSSGLTTILPTNANTIRTTSKTTIKSTPTTLRPNRDTSHP